MARCGTAPRWTSRPATSTHGQSFIGFGITRPLGFDLLPRIKQINHCKLYLPAAGDLDRYPRLRPALTNLQREINAWLNVVDYNGVNDYIFFGKSGELSSNRREEQWNEPSPPSAPLTPGLSPRPRTAASAAPSPTPDKVEFARLLKDQGHTRGQIAAKTGIPKT
jgi:hypothetical protein